MKTYFQETPLLSLLLKCFLFYGSSLFANNGNTEARDSFVVDQNIFFVTRSEGWQCLGINNGYIIDSSWNYELTGNSVTIATGTTIQIKLVNKNLLSQTPIVLNSKNINTQTGIKNGWKFNLEITNSAKVSQGKKQQKLEIVQYQFFINRNISVFIQLSHPASKREQRNELMYFENITEHFLATNSIGLINIMAINFAAKIQADSIRIGSYYFMGQIPSGFTSNRKSLSQPGYIICGFEDELCIDVTLKLVSAPNSHIITDTSIQEGRSISKLSSKNNIPYAQISPVNLVTERQITLVNGDVLVITFQMSPGYLDENSSKRVLRTYADFVRLKNGMLRDNTPGNSVNEPPSIKLINQGNLLKKK